MDFHVEADQTSCRNLTDYYSMDYTTPEILGTMVSIFMQIASLFYTY